MLITEIAGLDLDDERLTPNLLAERCEAVLQDLKAERAACKRKADRSKLNRRIHSANVLLSWAKSRAGYRKPVKVEIVGA